MSDRLVSLLLASVLIAASIAWIAQTLDAPADDIGDDKQAVTVAAPPIEKLPNNAASIRRESDGYFWTRANVDGSSIQFLVDTGASAVVLNWRDAKRLRLDLDALTYDNRVTTAGGQVMAASIVIDSISIGNVEIEDINALVLQEDLLEDSLLGMSFLGQLYSYEFKGNTMIIRQ